MNKLLVPAIIGVVVAAVGALLLLQKSAQEPATPTDQAQPSSQTASLRGLMDLANNQRCTFSDAESKSVGEVMAGGGKVRGNFSTTTDSETVNSHMISDGTTLYLWIDGQTDGIKASIAELEELSDNFSAQGQQSIDLNREVDYSCGPWTIDDSVFAIPNINFQDMGAMMEGFENLMREGEGEDDTKARQCEACESLPAEAAQSCRQALGC